MLDKKPRVWKGVDLDDRDDLCARDGSDPRQDLPMNPQALYASIKTDLDA
jgi:hypothetical protein